MDEQGSILRFPPQFSVVALPDEIPEPPVVPEPALVDHGGRTYRLAELLACLSPAKLVEIEATMPRSGQAAWDEVVRRWPGLAEEIVADWALN